MKYIFGNVTQTHDRHSCVLTSICPNIHLLLILKCVCKNKILVTTSIRTSVFPKTVFFLVYVNVSFIVHNLNILLVFSRRNVRLGYKCSKYTSLVSLMIFFVIYYYCFRCIKNQCSESHYLENCVLQFKLKENTRIT